MDKAEREYFELVLKYKEDNNLNIEINVPAKLEEDKNKKKWSYIYSLKIQSAPNIAWFYQY